MELKKLDPNDPYEKLMIKHMERAKKDPPKFYRDVAKIIQEAKENACRKIGIPIDTELDDRVMIGTTEDGIVFLSRVDLLVYPGQKLLWMKDLV